MWLLMVTQPLENCKASEVKDGGKMVDFAGYAMPVQYVGKESKTNRNLQKRPIQKPRTAICSSKKAPRLEAL